MRQTLGDKHPDTLTSINNMAVLLEAQGKPAEAEALYREALAGTKHPWRPSPPRVCQTMSCLLTLRLCLSRR